MGRYEKHPEPKSNRKFPYQIPCWEKQIREGNPKNASSAPTGEKLGSIAAENRELARGGIDWREVVGRLGEESRDRGKRNSDERISVSGFFWKKRGLNVILGLHIITIKQI